MVDYSLIKQMRVRGKTYREIARDLNVSFSTISQALKLKEARNATPRRSVDYKTSLFQNENLINGERATLPRYSFFVAESSNNMDGDLSINKKATKLVADSGGLCLVPMDNPGPSSNSQLIVSAPAASLFWKVFLFVGLILIIKLLRKIEGYTFEIE